MQLKDYIPNINKKFGNIFFSGIAFESQKVKKNDIFFAIKGTNRDGNYFIPSAIKKGSKIIVTEKKIQKPQKKILYLYSKNIRKLLAEVSFKIYKKRPKNLIAVTGTNGKSSVVNFFYQILKLNKKKVASIGTLGVKSSSINSNLSNTTIDPLQLGQILEKLYNYKINNVIMEASSHGLQQHRLDGLKFDIGIFTNLSQDHLDYHKNLNNYLKAKLYLFEKLIKKKGNIITDEKIPQFNKIKKISKKRNLKLASLNKDENFKILSHIFKGELQILKIKYKNSVRFINLNLIGKIQIKNILMAIIAAQKSNIEFEKILKILPKIKPIEGRLERIGKIKNKSKVILDYAHTPDALKTSLVNLREQFSDKKIILLFGCGGNRDQSKRSKMGKIADIYSDEIYLTDDNPRFENPSEIRADIKKGINKKKKFFEIPDRAKAISKSVQNLKTGEILLVAGKGHEKTQDIRGQKVFFSDKKIISDSIKIKNMNLNNNLKLNIIKELSGSKKISSKISFRKAKINSKEVRKHDIFFAIKGKKKDGNKFVKESLKNKALLAIVSKVQKNLDFNRQIKVRDTLKFLTNVSKIFRRNLKTKIIAITGSCGKTTLKELLGNTLKKISKVNISPKSYNNKYGVPLSLFNLNQNDDYGVLEVGMDKKGEINYLSEIIRPDVSVITNINYAHAKNFKNIKEIALAKSEIIQNTKTNGYIVLNADDNFFRLHKKIAFERNLKVISFGIKNNKSSIKFSSIKKKGSNFEIGIKMKNFRKFFIINNDFQNNIYNILASLAVMSIYIDIFKLKRNIFLNFKTPEGRGDISKIKINKKKINLIDESYNSNPLSLESAILNFDKIANKKYKKYLLLGDMLELGTHSKKLHKSILPIINKSKVDKVFVKGNKVSCIFDGLLKSKKGAILSNNSQILKLLRDDLNNNDYLMIKASNATGFNKIVNNLKG